MQTLYPAVACALVLGCAPSGGRRSDVGVNNLVPDDVSADEVVIGFPDDVEAPDVGQDIGKPDVAEVLDDVPGVPDEGPDILDPSDEGDEPDEWTPPLTDVTGGVLVLQVDNAQLKVGRVSARFQQGLPPEPEPVLVEGPCKVLVYDGTPGPDPAPGLDGGLITVEGLNQPVVMTPADTGGSIEYDSGLPDDNETILGGSAMVLVSAEGGAHVGGWAGQVQVPAPVSVASPSNSAEKGKDIAVVWNPAGAQSIRLDLFVFDGGDGEQKKGHTISCALEGDTGSYTVPGSLTGKLPGGSSGPFNFDYLIVGVSRINVSQVPLPEGQGTVSVAVSRSGGNVVQFED